MDSTQREKDVVYMYMFFRNKGKQVPNVSPYGIKLETWLRLNNVKHEVKETSNFNDSPTKEIPFIYYNDVHMSDSSLIIDFLTKELGLDPTEGLTPEQQGIARAITKLCELELVYTYFHYRYVQHVDEWSRVFQASPVPQVDARIKEAMQKSIEEKLKQVGIGRKSVEEIASIGKQSVLALSHILGDKEFFMGDKPTKVDCCVFGILSQLYVDIPYPHKEVLEGEGSNLTAFMERMKARAWPDWDALVDKSNFE